MAGKEQPLSQEEIDLAYQYLAMLAAQQSRHIQEQQQKEAETNEPALFEKLKSEKPNLKQAPLGYYYEVLQEGKGHKATVGKRISIDFIASELATGKVFENTYNDHTIVHVLGKPMFEGILDGLQLMNAGSKYRFYFPSKLVKGASGVAPYTPLVYEVELHEIFEEHKPEPNTLNRIRCIPPDTVPFWPKAHNTELSTSPRPNTNTVV